MSVIARYLFKMARNRIRLDVLLAERELFPSRTAAARAVRAGQVKLGRDGPLALRPSQEIRADQELELIETKRFASRGGIKLDNALKQLGLEIRGRRCLDVGASTGGFTDCLLSHGAAHVIALDVAYGQIADSLRRHPDVTVIERFNARHLRPNDLEYAPDLVVIDVSFISLTKVLGPVRETLAPGGEVLAMVKPQFELGRSRVGRGGVVRDPADRREAVARVADFALDLGFGLSGIAPTRLPGPKGNLETFIRLGPPGAGAPDGATLCEGVAV